MMRKLTFILLASGALVLQACGDTAISDRIANRFRSGPRGVMDLQPGQRGETVFDPNDPGWTNPHVKGLRLRSQWDKCESTQGVYLHGYLDSAVALAQANNKQLGWSISMCQHTPAYAVSLGAVVVTLSDGPTSFPWDPVVLARNLALLDDWGPRYDGKIAYLVVGGIGRDDSTAIAQTDDDAAIADANAPGGDGLAAFQTTCDTVIDRVILRFPHTPIIINVEAVYAGTTRLHDGSVAAQVMTDRIKAKYPQVGFMNTNLTAHPGGNNLPYQVVFTNPDRPSVVQFITNSRGFGGVTLGGSVGETLIAAEVENAHACEVYKLDCDDPTYWPDLDQFNDNAP